MAIFNNSYVQVTFTLSISLFISRALKLAMVTIVTLVLGMLTLICAKVRKNIAFANFSAPNKLSLYFNFLPWLPANK